MDIAGIGEKPTTRSGPNFLMVKALAAATISLASSQLARTKPPWPRLDLYCLANSGVWLICSQASTGLRVWRASRHNLASRPRIIGYLTRWAE